MLLLLLLVPVVSTLLGGLVAVRFRRSMPMLIAVGAGLLLGAAFLDLLPESVDLGVKVGWGAREVLGLTLGFFLVFAAVESFLDLRAARAVGGGARRTLGRFAGGLMIFHSFRDGMAIGAAFAASHAVGYAVTLGIAAHDLGDGMNTVILTTGGGKVRRSDYLFLLADAAAPFLGGMLTIWWMVSSRGVVVLLALAAGFFLQMATSDLLPRVRDVEGRRGVLLGAVMGGAGVIWMANWLIER